MLHTKKRRRSASPAQLSSNKEVKSSGRPSPDSTSDANKNWKQWKRQQSHDYNTHQFLDASATVNAGLFGARRLPEIKILWRRLVQEDLNAVNGGNGRPNYSDDDNRTREGGIRRAGESGGGKISSRHLRRRTNSHRPRRRHRFPHGKTGSDGYDDACLKEDAVSDNGVTDTGRDICAKNISGGPNQTNHVPCRRARRKPALMRASHSGWWQPRMNAQSALPSNDHQYPHNWIPTHLWHAKRFHISPKLFSWSIPLINCNRGSRASLRLASSITSPKCTIQDGTWEIHGCAIKLEARKVDTPAESTQAPSQSLISILQRLCDPEAPFLSDEAILAGKRAGEGIVHEIDSSPLQPIGPATFLFGRLNDNCNDYDDAHVCMLINPAVHQRVVFLISEIIRNCESTSVEVTLSTMPLALLRIRGRAAMSTLREVLGQADNIGLLDDDAHHGTMIDIGVLPPRVEARKSDSNNQSWIKLKCHQPNQAYQHLPHNLASSGWDVLCSPSNCLSLFQSLVIDGGACPIGVVEEARAQLEAYPPVPIFPRDYPDTEEGKRYWDGGTRAASMKNEGGDEKQLIAGCMDWAVIRVCVEGSWGRINTPLKRTIRHWEQQNKKEKRSTKKESVSITRHESAVPQLVTKKSLLGRDTVSIHWESLTPPDNPIVVRGSFGIPFLQLLHSCGRLHSQPGPKATENRCHRRPRRKVLPPHWVVHASPLSKKESDFHSQLCQQLRASLSLPALVRCELLASKGALKIGDLIYPLTSECDDDGSVGSSLNDGAGHADIQSHPSPLGVVTAGGFSPSRGKCHGIGFVGAAKLIDALDVTHGMGISIPQSNGLKKMVLKVMIVSDTSSASCSRSALLSILL
jgi:hypothetical protein